MKLPETHYRAVSKSADAVIASGGGVMGGFLVTASASGVIRFYDNSAVSGTVLIDSLAVAAGDLKLFKLEFATGLAFDLVSGTATVTIFYIGS